jgi:hypothetical protein
MSATRRAIVVTLSVALVAVLLVEGIALAHTKTHPRSLSLTRAPAGIVAPGTSVTFQGRLSSPKLKCRRNSTITLVNVNTGDVVGSDGTDRAGRYSITVTVRDTTRYRASFAGKVLRSVHPHSRTCSASRSNRLRVRVS